MVELIGRRGELAVLRRVVESTATGSSTAVVVEGDAGIGKTQLLRTLAREADAGGTVVLRGGITEAESTISWAGMSAMVDSLDATVVELRAAGAEVIGEIVDVSDSGQVAQLADRAFQLLLRSGVISG